MSPESDVPYFSKKSSAYLREAEKSGPFLFGVATDEEVYAGIIEATGVDRKQAIRRGRLMATRVRYVNKFENSGTK